MASRKQRYIRKTQDGSAYWGYYEAGVYNPTENIVEPIKANPDQSSEGFDPWTRNLSEDDEAKLAAYYRGVDAGALNTLTPKEKQVWKAIFFRKMSENEVAKKVGISRSSVRVYLKRAGYKIQVWLKEKK